MKTLVTSELVFKIPIKVYMCVLKHNIGSWPQMISFLTYFKIAQLQVFTEKVLFYVLPNFTKRIFSVFIFPSVTFQDS